MQDATKRPIHIDLQGRYKDPSLYARIVWQELFNIYEAGDGNLQNMDNLLCDYTILQRAFEEDEFELFWGFSGRWTTMQERPFEDQYKITRKGDNVTIEFIKGD